MHGIDSHCHLEFMADAVEEAKTRMAGIVTSAPDIKDYNITMELAEKHKGFVHACLGLHPTHIPGDPEKAFELIRKNADKIVAVGETGIDYHHLRTEEERQKSENLFKKMIEIANELRLPLVVHSRSENADKENKGVQRAIDVLAAAKVGVMMHFFSGSAEQMDECISRGYMISFTTMICISKKYRKLARDCPMENMLLETDAPWLDPGSPGTLTNRPWNIGRSAEAIAGIRKMTADEVLKATEDNARRFFKI